MFDGILLSVVGRRGTPLGAVAHCCALYIAVILCLMSLHVVTA